MNEIDFKCNYDCYNYKKDNNLLSLNELLFDLEKAQELYCAQSRHNYEIEKSNSAINDFLQNDCNYTFIFESKQFDVKSKNIDNNNDSNFYLNSDNLTCKTQDEKKYFFSTLSTSIIDSKAKCNS